MKTLHEIKIEYLNALFMAEENGGEISEELLEEMDQIEAELSVKIENYCGLIDHLEALEAKAAERDAAVAAMLAAPAPGALLSPPRLPSPTRWSASAPGHSSKHSGWQTRENHRPDQAARPHRGWPPHWRASRPPLGPSYGRFGPEMTDDDWAAQFVTEH